jgi:hypothetical protein
MVRTGSTPNTMIFQERKQPNDEFSYDVEDVFGTVHIESSVKLTGDILDGIVMVLLKQNISAEEIRGEVKHDKGVVQYVFKKRPMWEDEDEEKQPCKDTHTSTQKPESASTRTRLLRIPILSWCGRFAEAFREAWKSAKK